jgi:hypothetical protein
MNDVHDMRTGGAMSIVVARGAGPIPTSLPMAIQQMDPVRLRSRRTRTCGQSCQRMNRST